MDAEQRNSNRKALKTTGQLRLDMLPPVMMHTINVARDGMAITSEEPVVEGAHYRVHFDIPVNGVTCPVAAAAQVVFCVYAGHSEFKSGLHFTDLDSPSAAAIVCFLGH